MLPTLSLEPSIENCDPLVLYQRSTPTEFSFSENPVLYGGGRKWLMTGLECIQQVDLYVLDTQFAIWLVELGYGYTIPYSWITGHSVMKDEGKLKLLMQVEGLNLTFTPMYSESERYVNDTIERLFSYDSFGVNKGDTMVLNTYTATNRCMMLNMMGDLDYDSLDGSELSSDNAYDNTGDADDMDGNYQLDSMGDASIPVSMLETRTRMREGDCNFTGSKRLRC